MNTGFLMSPMLPWGLRIVLGVFTVLYSVVAWWAYQDLKELFEEQSGSSGSSEGREVIEVITQ